MENFARNGLREVHVVDKNVIFQWEETTRVYLFLLTQIEVHNRMGMLKKEDPALFFALHFASSFQNLTHEVQIIYVYKHALS